jgi:hypothetical protein
MTTAPKQFVIGLDLGKLRDFSAVCVLQRRAAEVAPRTGGWQFDEDGNPIRPGQVMKPARYNVGYLQRFKLNTPYPEIIAQVRTLRGRLPGAP